MSCQTTLDNKGERAQQFSFFCFCFMSVRNARECTRRIKHLPPWQQISAGFHRLAHLHSFTACSIRWLTDQCRMNHFTAWFLLQNNHLPCLNVNNHIFDKVFLQIGGGKDIIGQTKREERLWMHFQYFYSKWLPGSASRKKNSELFKLRL